MAGNYLDVPGPRMAWHRDGSAMVWIDASNNVSILSSGTRIDVNDESNNNATGTQYSAPFQGTGNRFVVLFPELRDLNGMWVHLGDNGNASGPSNVNACQTSVDTTTGLDGIWTTRAIPNHITNGATSPSYRTSISSYSLTGIKGVRLTLSGGNGGTNYMRVWHLYGKPTTGQTRYLITTDTGGTEVGGAYFDFGDDPQNSTETISFKIKNDHGSLTAQSIDISFSVLTDKSPIMSDDYTFSTDNVSFTSTINIGDLAPGVSSGTLYVKRITPIAATTGLETGIIIAAAGSWV